MSRRRLFDRKILTAAFVAPLVAPLIGATLATIEVLRGVGLDMTPPLMYVVEGAMVGFVMGYVPCVALGLPVIAVLRRLDALTARNCLLASIVLGFAIPAAFMAVVTLSSTDPANDPAGAAAIVGAGATLVSILVGAAFCLLARLPFRRPNSRKVEVQVVHDNQQDVCPGA